MNDEFDVILRQAIRQEAFRAPVLIEPGALEARLAADACRRRKRRSWSALGAAVLGVVAVAGIMIRPLQSFFPGGGTTPAPCVISTPTKHGSWWIEIGGPGAFFNVEPGTLYAEPNPWLITTRFDPDAESGQEVAIWAERIGSDERIPGTLNSLLDPSNIYRLSERAPALPGGWYLFEQRFLSAGCWRISAAIGGRVVGSAVIDITYGPLSTADPNASFAPTPRIAPILEAPTGPPAS